jgi:hydrogenase-4 membrane subunit HyfE
MIADILFAVIVSAMLAGIPYGILRTFEKEDE